MKTSKFLFVGMIALLTFAFACSPVRVNYIGNDYSPTSDITLFFNPDDIDQNYRTIGKMILTAPEGLRSEKLQRKLEREAQSKGADGALVEIFDQLYNGRRLNAERHWHSSTHYEDQEEDSRFSGTYVRVSLLKFE